MTRRGASLVELMFSMLILGIGLSSVASLFPTTEAIHESPLEDALGKQVAENVQAAVRARGFSRMDMTRLSPGRPTETVQPMPDDVLHGSGSARVAWLLPDRCYPSPGAADPRAVGGSHYWVPLVQERASGEWRVFVFVLHRGASNDYGPHAGSANPDDPAAIPWVRSVAALPVADDKQSLSVPDAASCFAQGDAVLGSAGQVLTVRRVEGGRVTFAQRVDPQTTEIWYAARNGAESSAKRILPLDGVVR